MAAGKLKLQANDGKVAGIVFEDGAVADVTVTVPKEGGEFLTTEGAQTKAVLTALNAKQDSATAINASNITQQSVANATKWNGATMYTSTSEPSGGVSGDLWLQYAV